ncbi:tRNA (N(6)-L-threonylcarbamoyladenosine(37)-C(2))-methylthiotransferase MtaB [Wolbachia endosymbiont of Brugia malayi]|uniref:tRNA (N(6)-L-threonylcarbamoyladenosine(37)-C(2))- methylthiotransferase MtaB n=1 Tax=unclassified Wolbachia TaxID=2640676 RepID=UPI00004C9276|nr:MULTISPECIES: tRNA (N(6)-L-threonylcarbamoyladenosine(37)-C(2))-methylthiotransferase MtaB [unclassified Wolbachia]AAW70693.1 2-methylthioadenine synthetase [Wolbachia endosymbiont strain TRS of Brugia malayi]QCB61673.1 tRNA (N(6)-L-threonylcarbamoyladenosine(37)-C(2))-methylthiotransferase MtaB [Wolbachia endosymbiont of Brugia malayi]QIT35824.1 radical SAM methylthiotransferase, MiaB/RimO family protein [Wolbachia endosymbiont of Brugia pahangi]
MNEVVTFGCRLNFYESELIKEALRKAERENVVVVHSCAVTNEAERQVKQKIRKIYKNDPNKEIIVVGCAVQLDPESYSNIPGVSKVLGNQDKLKTENYLLSNNKILVNDNQASKSEPALIDKFKDKSRAFIEVQNGCDHSCTFCSITEARGNNRSVPINNIIEQIKIFVANGYQEVVFTGVDITDFGTDLFGKPSLGLMVRRVLKDVPELKRLRLSSIDVAEVDDELMDLIVNESRFMPHLHLSLQSGNNLILKRMKRRHSREQVIEFCHKVKSLRSNIAYGADIIAGFPTETDEMFQDTVNLLEETNTVYLHAFPYSKRKNTPAARMPQVPENVRKERVKNLRKINKAMMSNFYQSLIGTKQSVLVEQNNIGRAENFALVKFTSKIQAKSIVKATIIGMESGYLVGSIIP